jgi:hypothetical protein
LVVCACCNAWSEQCARGNVATGGALEGDANPDLRWVDGPSRRRASASRRRRRLAAGLG